MQQVVQEAMSGMSASGDEGLSDKGEAGAEADLGDRGLSGGVRGSGSVSDGETFARTVSSDREEGWALRLAEAEESVVSRGRRDRQFILCGDGSGCFVGFNTSNFGNNGLLGTSFSGWWFSLR